MSESVLRERDSVRSALVKAFDAWKTPYDIKPEGVFGSVAVIKSGQVTLSSESLDIEFDVPFDDDMEPNEAEITVYNLSDNTLKQLKNNAVITIEAGFKGDTGVLFRGYITSVKTKQDDVDKTTTIKALDDIKSHTVESLSFKANTKASYILKTLIDKTGIPVAVFEPRREHIYTDSQTINGDLMENIRRYAEVCGISVYVSRGKIYARYIKKGDNLNFNLSADTGLIGSPSTYTEEVKAADFKDTIDGVTAKMLLQHRMCAGAIIKLSSKSVSGTYRVCSGKHRFSAYECTTEVDMY